MINILIFVIDYNNKESNINIFKIKMDEEGNNQLKTLCEYLISNRFYELADYQRFKKCFEHLIKFENNSLKNLYDYIVGVFKDTKNKRKYITYTRLCQAYLKYKKEKNKNNTPEYISFFFDKLFMFKNKIRDGENNTPRNDEIAYFTSLEYLDSELSYISKVVVLCNNERKILGLKIGYNNKSEEILKMYTEENLYKALELNLCIIKEKNNYVQTEIRDSITHIFGTFNNVITSIGFKCVSGKIIHFGKPEGNPFLFGEYGKKVQCLDLAIDKNGIRELEVYFADNPQKNENIKFKKEEIDKIYYDENLMLSADENNYELIRINRNIFKDNDDIDIEKFDGEDIFIKPLFISIDNNKYIDNGKDLYLSEKLKNNSLIFINENKNYLSYPNPFFPFDENPELMIPNPFFPEAGKTQKKAFKEKKASKYGLNQTFNLGLQNNYEENFYKKLSKTVISDNKEKRKEINKNFLKLKDQVISNIYKTIIKKCENDEVDIDTQNALEIILNNEENKSNKDKTIYEKERIKEEENEEEEEEDKHQENKNDNNNKIEALKFLFEEYGVKSNQVQNEIINKLEKNKKELLTKTTLDLSNFEELNKRNAQIILNKSSGEIFIKQLELLNDMNNFKVKEEEKEEKKEEEKEEKKEEEKEEIKEEGKEEEEEEKEEEEKDINEIEPIQNEIEEEEKIIKNEEEKTKMIEKINQNKDDLKKCYGNQFNLYELEFSKDSRKKEENDVYKSFVNIEKEKKNILIKSFYSKIVENIKIFGREKLPKKLKTWTDPNFDKEKALGKKWSQDKKIKWSRPDEKKEYFIFKNSPTKEKIKQSKNIRDCYFLSALGALCDKNTNDFNIIKNLFLITEKTKEHAYGIYFYISGKRRLVLIDDYLPYDKDNKLFFSSSFDESELWVALIEKAWAKVRGGYENISDSQALKAFEVLTGNYTKQIKIGNINYNKDKLWETLEKFKNYPICAGTKQSGIDLYGFDNVGLKPKHEYILIKVFDEGGKKVKLRDPYGIVNNNYKNKDLNIGRGFIISYDDFWKYFFLVEINYYKNYKRDNIDNLNNNNDGKTEHFITIPKKESLRCQFIKIINEYENNEVFINLYQTYKQVPVFSYIMLIKKEDVPNKENRIYSYVKSITSQKSGGYEDHIALNEISLKKGTYYICCDVNNRFLYSKQNEKIHGYSLKILSEKKIKIENVTEEIQKNEGIKMLQESLIDLVEEKKCKEYKNGENSTQVEVLYFKDKGILPFDVFYFNNIHQNKKYKIQFEIDQPKLMDVYHIYNDEEFSEFDKSLVKEINPGQKIIIMIMNSEYSLDNNNRNKQYLKYKVSIIEDIKYEHPVFNEKKEDAQKLKDKINFYILEDSLKRGFIFGVENITNNDLKLRFKFEGLFVINPKEWNYAEETLYKFILKKGEKKIFNIRTALKTKNYYSNLEIDE